MKILVSGYHNPLYLTIVEYIENGVKLTGNDLIAFDDHQFIFPGRVRKYLPFLNSWDLKNVNKKLHLLAVEKKPDLVLVTQGFLVLKETVKKIKQLNIPIVMWVIDAPLNFTNILDAAPYYDFIFCGGTEAIEIFKDQNFKNIEWLPFACDQDLQHLQTYNDQREVLSKDVVFVGSHYSSREHTLSKLKLDDYDLGIWGSGWDKVSADSPLNKLIQKTHTKPEEWIRLYNQSKIILVNHYQENKEIPVYQASPKIYEALACGGFVICDNQKDVRTLFIDGEHLVIVKNIEELNEKIDYYLTHDIERQMISENGRKEVLSKHTYTHRIKKLLETLQTEGILQHNSLH